mgnify:FL=1
MRDKHITVEFLLHWVWQTMNLNVLCHFNRHIIVVGLGLGLVIMVIKIGIGLAMMMIMKMKMVIVMMMKMMSGHRSP